MTVRSYLFLVFLPITMIITLLISLMVYFDARREIIHDFTIRLETASKTCSQFIDNDLFAQQKKISYDKLLQKNQKILSRLQDKLHLSNIYILTIEPHPKPSYDSSYPKPKFLQNVIISATGFEKAIPYTLNKVEINLLYRENRSITTKFYRQPKTKNLFLSSFSPIVDRYSNVIAIVGTDIDISVIQNKFYKALTIIIFVDSIILITMLILITLISNHIKGHIKKLKNKALSLSAGSYTDHITIRAPKEISELASTLNTLSECLQENLIHVQQDSLLRERMYGEHECSLLLQRHMIRDVVEEYSHPKLQLMNICAISNDPHGVLVDINTVDENMNFIMLESRKHGFREMYKLVLEYCHRTRVGPKSMAYLKFVLDIDRGFIDIESDEMPLPIIYSEGVTKIGDYNNVIKSGDMIFIFNQGLELLFKRQKNESVDWFDKVLKHFSEDGLESCMSILNKELNFITRKLSSYRDVYIIGLYIQ